MGYKHVNEAVAFVEGKRIAPIVRIVPASLLDYLRSHIGEQSVELSWSPLATSRYLDLEVHVSKPDVPGVLISAWCHFDPSEISAASLLTGVI